MIDPKDVTIIIPHLGGTPESEYALGQCMESLYETFDNKNDKNILLVKNGYNQCDHNERADIVVNEQGQCKAVNAAVATTNTPWIFITNDDMIYSPGWWEALTGGSNVQCVSPKLVEPRPGAPTFIVEFMGGAGGDFDKQKWLEYADKYHFANLPNPKDYITGFNLPFLIKRELWDMVGGYDINYDPWGSNSDSDLEYKIKLAGVQPIQNQRVVVYHFSQTSGTFNPENASYYQKNFQVFKDKWGFDRTDDGIWEATFEIPDDRKFRPDWEGKWITKS